MPEARDVPRRSLRALLRDTLGARQPAASSLGACSWTPLLPAVQTGASGALRLPIAVIVERDVPFGRSPRRRTVHRCRAELFRRA